MLMSSLDQRTWGLKEHLDGTNWEKGLAVVLWQLLDPLLLWPGCPGGHGP